MQHDSLNSAAINQGIYSLRILRMGIWAYFLLLIFEGALRKWFLPGLATPLLIVRDPIALFVILLSWQQGFFKFTLYSGVVVVVTLLSFILTMIWGHQNLFVAIFGARILLIHFPFMFVMGKILDRKDVIKIGKILLWISIPMIILNILQFYSPQSAWVNRGVGGDLEGAGFSGALGYFRPPGTFSFINGLTSYWGLVAPFVFYFWLDNHHFNKIALAAFTASLFIAIPISISRTLLFEVCLTAAFASVIFCLNPKYLKSVVIGGLLATILLAALSQTSFVQTGLEAFESRFTTANESEGGLEGVFIDRFLGGLIGAIINSTDQLFSGFGLGIGTNAGAAMLTGERTFLVSEGEWGRLVGEMGLIIGLTVIAIRSIFVTDIGISSFKKVLDGNFLPWLLLSFGIHNILQGQWAQPTALGFSTLSGGLILASLKNDLPIEAKQLLLIHLKDQRN